MTRFTRFLRKLKRSRSGTAVLEFALTTPLLLTAGLWGTEVANQAITQMRIGQVAILVADNASRVGENSLLGETKLYESDIDDVLLGAEVQSGLRNDLYDNGRIILSSLEVVPDTDDRQYIHWQRCKGKKQVTSSYGQAGDGLDTTIAGMGPPGEEIQALKGEAVMFVEIQYDYQPMISGLFASASTMTATAAFNVRDNRDLTQIYQRDDANPDPVASCSTYDSFSK